MQLRLTPDEWMIPLFGQEQSEGERNVLEGRLIWLALSALRIGVNVVLDFGVWGKDERRRCERWRPRWEQPASWFTCKWTGGAVAASPGSLSDPDRRRNYLRDDQGRPLTMAANLSTTGHTELETTDIDPPPAGFDSWDGSVARWWPTSVSGYGSIT